MSYQSEVLAFVKNKLSDPGLNISEIARQAGVARNTVLAMRSGDNGPKGPALRNLEEVAAVLGYKIKATRSNKRAEHAQSIEQ